MSERASSESEEQSGSASDSDSELQLMLKALEVEKKIIETKRQLIRKRSRGVVSDNEEPPAKRKKKRDKSPLPANIPPDEDHSDAAILPVPVPKPQKKTKKSKEPEKQTSREFYYRREVLTTPKGMATTRPKPFNAYSASPWGARDDEDGWNRFREYIRHAVQDHLNTKSLWTAQTKRHETFIGIVEADYPVLRFQRQHFTINHAASSYLRHCIKEREKKKPKKSSVSRALSVPPESIPTSSTSPSTPGGSVLSRKTPTSSTSDTPDESTLQTPPASTDNFNDPDGGLEDIQHPAPLPIYSMGGEIYPVPEMNTAPQTAQIAVTPPIDPALSSFAPSQPIAPVTPKHVPTNKFRRAMIYEDPPTDASPLPTANNPSALAMTSQPSHLSPSVSPTTSTSVIPGAPAPLVQQKGKPATAAARAPAQNSQKKKKPAGKVSSASSTNRRSARNKK